MRDGDKDNWKKERSHNLKGKQDVFFLFFHSGVIIYNHVVKPATLNQSRAIVFEQRA